MDERPNKHSKAFIREMYERSRGIKECKFACQDCGHIFTSMAKVDCGGTTEPCPKCRSNIGSYRREDLEE